MIAGSLMRSLSRSSTRRISPWPGRNARIEPDSAPQGTHHRVRHLILDARIGIAAEIARLDREGAALAGDDGSVAEKLRNPRAVERRRHRQDAQVIAQAALAVEREGKPQIGIERALVELVEQHRADAGKLGIIEDHAREHALGDDLDARLRPRFRDHPRAQSDAFADALATRSAPCARRRPRGDAARLQHQDLSTLEPASSIKASGTRVVLPAPGGATRTAEFRAASAARNSSSTASIGSGVVNCMAAVSSGTGSFARASWTARIRPRGPYRG